MRGLVDFWNLAWRLKRETRKGWVQKLGLSQAESVADHTYAVAMLSLYEGVRRQFDTAKLLKMALIHDLEEAFTGDLTPQDKKSLGVKSVRRARQHGYQQVLARVPKEGRREYGGLWKELKAARSKEARLLKDLDLLEMALQANAYQGGGPRRMKVREFYASALRGVRDPELRRVVSQLE